MRGRWRGDDYLDPSTETRSSSDPALTDAFVDDSVIREGEGARLALNNIECARQGPDLSCGIWALTFARLVASGQRIYNALESNWWQGVSIERGQRQAVRVGALAGRLTIYYTSGVPVHPLSRRSHTSRTFSAFSPAWSHRDVTLSLTAASFVRGSARFG